MTAILGSNKQLTDVIAGSQEKYKTLGNELIRLIQFSMLKAIKDIDAGQAAKGGGDLKQNTKKKRDFFIS